MDWAHIGWLVLVGLSGGIFGAMMGVGGGAFIVPLLTLAMGFPVQVAIASSLVAVAGTACASSAIYVKAGLINIRLGLLLETTTTVGAIAGALLAVQMDARLLAGIFGLAVIYASFNMFRQRSDASGTVSPTAASGVSQGSFISSLAASYHDNATGGVVCYHPFRLKLGLGAGGLAGVLSGLLGIGGGVVKIPVMNLAMGVPMKAAIATSSFMIGITAVASSFVYYHRGYMDPLVAAPVFVGVFLGVQVGVRAMQRMQGHALRLVFAAILLVVATLMFLRAAGVLV